MLGALEDVARTVRTEPTGGPRVEGRTPTHDVRSAPFRVRLTVRDAPEQAGGLAQDVRVVERATLTYGPTADVQATDRVEITSGASVSTFEVRSAPRALRSTRGILGYVVELARVP